MQSTRYLIVGGGLTGDAACKGIRDVDTDGEITLVSDEQYPPYARPPLSKALWKGDEARREARVTVEGQTRELALVKSVIDSAALSGMVNSGGLVLVVEDRTEQHALHARVPHQARLASTGRLAAGGAQQAPRRAGEWPGRGPRQGSVRSRGGTSGRRCRWTRADPSRRPSSGGTRGTSRRG